MKAIVVGTGAGGATAARELASKGFEVLMLEGWAKVQSTQSQDYVAKPTSRHPAA